MARSSLRKAPSHYPFVPFHLIRITQLLSSIIVASILCFFIYHLVNDGITIPWTFLVLTAVSFVSIISICITTVISCCCGLNPKVNLVINTILCLKWTIGFALLSWNASYTLGNACDGEHWGEDGAGGRLVCRTYKALFTFALLGFVSTICAVALDVIIRKKQTQQGVYNQMEDFDYKYTGRDDPWSVEPSRDTRDSTAAKGGYEMPVEQFVYDTAYKGHEMH